MTRSAQNELCKVCRKTESEHGTGSIYDHDFDGSGWTEESLTNFHETAKRYQKSRNDN